jgi:low affinity Fe/Cu permease
MKFRQAFSQFARKTARFTGSPVCFAAAVLVVLAWAAAGPVFQFSETWQLVINTGTTIVTFLMVFLIQTTQNADTDAMQIKLDELIRALEPANNRMLALEELDEDTLADLRRQFDAMARKARKDENGEIVGAIDDGTSGAGSDAASAADETKPEAPHSPA